MKLTKAQLKKIIKEELEKVLENDNSHLLSTIRDNLKHVTGSKVEDFIESVYVISSMLKKMDSSVSSGLAWDDTTDDLEQKEADYENWHDHLGEIEYDPAYRKAVTGLVGMKVTTKKGTYPIVNVEMRKYGHTQDTAADIEFASPGKRTKKMPFKIEISDMGIYGGTTGAKQIMEIN